MISFDAAIALIDQQVVPLDSETLPLADAAGRVLAESLLARQDAPAQPTSSMDGYAVIYGSTRPGDRMTIIGESRPSAGFGGTVGVGETVRIFTGAPVPDGADGIIIQEYAERAGQHVVFAAGFGPARHIRPTASDFAAGDMLLSAGTCLAPRAMVAAAAADRAEVHVARQPRLIIISTGDELAAPGTAYQSPGKIAESVSYGVAALAQDAGALVIDRQRGVDDLPMLKRLAADALTRADVIVITGGASVGEHDFAKAMFADEGLDLVFAKVAVKPGKPVWLGRARGRWVIGLPGNPTSAMVTATLFLRPLLARLQGRALADMLPWQRLPLTAPLSPTDDRETFVRAVWHDDGLQPLGHQGSDAQAVLARAHWLIRCPAGQAAQSPGAIVPALPF